MPTEAAVKAEEALIHVLWINAGLSCDGDSVALTAATQPSIEEMAHFPVSPRSPSIGP
jgi:hydrogenase small subunit